MRFLQKNNFFFGYLISSVVFASIVILDFDKLPISESVYFWSEASSWEKIFKNPWHPPLYLVFLKLTSLISFGSYWGGYLLGLISVLLSGFLILEIIKFKKNINPGTIFLILFSYYTLPSITQGIFIFDIDNTLLTPILLWLTIISFKWLDKKKKETL